MIEIVCFLLFWSEKKTRKTKSSKKLWLVFSSSFPLTHKFNKKLMLKYYCWSNKKNPKINCFLRLKKNLNVFIYYIKIVKTFNLKRFQVLPWFFTKFQVFPWLLYKIPGFSRLFSEFLKFQVFWPPCLMLSNDPWLMANLESYFSKVIGINHSHKSCHWCQGSGI